MDVYVVTSGDYSDYHILAIFDNEAAADALVAFDPDERSVAVWTLNDASDHYRDGCAPFSVTLRDDREPYITLSEYGSSESVWTQWPERAPYFASGGYITVWARDKEHALKIASDKRAEFLAKREGIS